MLSFFLSISPLFLKMIIDIYGLDSVKRIKLFLEALPDGQRSQKTPEKDQKTQI